MLNGLTRAISALNLSNLNIQNIPNDASAICMQLSATVPSTACTIPLGVQEDLWKQFPGFFRYAVIDTDCSFTTVRDF